VRVRVRPPTTRRGRREHALHDLRRDTERLRGLADRETVAPCRRDCERAPTIALRLRASSVRAQTRTGRSNARTRSPSEERASRRLLRARAASVHDRAARPPSRAAGSEPLRDDRATPRPRRTATVTEDTHPTPDGLRAGCPSPSTPEAADGAARAQLDGTTKLRVHDRHRPHDPPPFVF